MSVKHYGMELEVQKQIFYSEDSMFGIYSCKPVLSNREIVNSYGTVSLQGVTRKLAVGDKYEIKFEGAYSHQRYGDYYKIVEVSPEKLNTVSEQDRFLQAVLADNHFNSLKKAYPDDLLVDLIMEDKIDVSKTKGIKKKTLAKIKETVEKNAGISVLIARLNELSLSTSAIDKILLHFKTADLALKAIEENIYNLCEVKYFGFLTVDKVALDRGDDPTNKSRINACIEYLLKKDNNDGHTWSNREKLTEDATDLLNINIELVEEVFTDLYKNNKFFIDEERVAFKSLKDKEMQIYKHLKRIRDSYSAPKINLVRDRLSTTEMEQGFKFTNEQSQAILKGSQNGVMILNGVAGSGKSATVKGLIDSLDTFNYMTCALSGKAASVLLQRGVSSSTIHRMLGRNKESGGFLYDETNKLSFSILVMDEVSMVNIDLFLAVARAVEDGAKLIIVGDSGQLPSIGAGDVLRDLLQTDVFPKYELTEVHRQAAKSGILQLANSIRKGNQIMPYDTSGREVYGELQDQTAISYVDKNAIPADVLSIAKSYKERIKSPQDLLDFQVIVSNRERGELSVRKLNIAMQKIFNNIEKPSLNRNGYEYRQGDKVIAQGNSYDQPVFEDEFGFFEYIESVKEDPDEAIKPRREDVYNGTMGYVYVININEKIVFFKFEGTDGIVAYHQNDLDKVDLAYAITVHKSQGSGIPHLVFALDFGAYTLLSRQLAYTAITRASEKGVVLFENNAMHKAISIDASQLRNTFLGDIIRGSY